jgi:hypothetical protein
MLATLLSRASMRRSPQSPHTVSVPVREAVKPRPHSLQSNSWHVPLCFAI